MRLPSVANLGYDLRNRIVHEGECDVSLDGAGETYVFRELCTEVLSPTAIGVMDQLREQILSIYDLSELLETRLPSYSREDHEELLVTRLKRVTSLLPADVSPMPNEVFTAIEFLVYEVEQRPVRIGEAIIRLEALADEIRADPLLHSLVTGRAN